VLIAGAHPLLGGNMQNNVTTALRRGLAQQGAAALTFEYRRPTNSDTNDVSWPALIDEFWRTHHVACEPVWRRDSGDALRFLRHAVSASTVLVGYSFGCWSLAELSASNSAAALVCISPNPNDHDLETLRSASAPLLVVTSDNDFSCTLDRLMEWYESLRGPKALECRPGAEHFFRGREDEIVRIVAGFLQSLNLLSGALTR